MAENDDHIRVGWLAREHFSHPNPRRATKETFRFKITKLLTPPVPKGEKMATSDYHLTPKVLEEWTGRRSYDIDPLTVAIETRFVPFMLGVDVLEGDGKSNKSLVHRPDRDEPVVCQRYDGELCEFDWVLHPSMNREPELHPTLDIHRDDEIEKIRRARATQYAGLVEADFDGGFCKFKPGKCNDASAKTRVIAARGAPVTYGTPSRTNWFGRNAHLLTTSDIPVDEKPISKVLKDGTRRFVVNEDGYVTERERFNTILRVPGHGLGNGLTLRFTRLAGDYRSELAAYITFDLILRVKPAVSRRKLIDEEIDNDRMPRVSAGYLDTYEASVSEQAPPAYVERPVEPEEDYVEFSDDEEDDEEGSRED